MKKAWIILIDDIKKINTDNNQIVWEIDKKLLEDGQYEMIGEQIHKMFNLVNEQKNIRSKNES